MVEVDITFAKEDYLKWLKIFSILEIGELTMMAK